LEVAVLVQREVVKQTEQMAQTHYLADMQLLPLVAVVADKVMQLVCQVALAVEAVVVRHHRVALVHQGKVMRVVAA
jgi:hypothetical protein